MARYFFHTQDGVSCRDDDGVELPDMAAAKRTAVRIVSEMLPDVADFWDTCSFTVVCSDETNLTLFQIDVGATVAAVSRKGSPA